MERPTCKACSPRTRLNASSAVVSMVVLLVLAGCAAPRPAGLQRAEDALANGAYQQAFDDAQPIADSSDAAMLERQHAAYLAGTAAYKLDDLPRAERYLEMASRSPDAALAADARAMLGLVHFRRDAYERAVQLLDNAARSLDGRHRAEALFYAGSALQRLGRWNAANERLNQARAAVSDPAFRRIIDRQRAVTGFGVQTGAFVGEQNAQRAADALTTTAERLQLPAARVVPAASPQNRTLHLVQIGPFRDWREAVTARQRLGDDDAIVVPIAWN